MKLYYSNTSPYSRKVRLTAREKGLEEQIEETLVNPFSDDKDRLVAANPLGKIPTLILDNGTALYDSSVICEYLDGLTDSSLLIPASTPSSTGDNSAERFAILRWQATADGMTDAAYNLVMEKRRAIEDQSQQWMSNWSTEITRILDYIESGINDLKDAYPDNPTLAHLALASAVSYLEFRLPEIFNESECPNTKMWYDNFKTRSSMQATVLHDAVT